MDKYRPKDKPPIPAPKPYICQKCLNKIDPQFMAPAYVKFNADGSTTFICKKCYQPNRKEDDYAF